MGNPQWSAVDEFATAAGRVAAQATVDARVAEWTSIRRAEDVMALCQAAGVPAGVVQTGVDLLENEGIDGADAFIATTNDEETNLMSCLLARRMGAKKTIALIRRTNYVPLVPQVGIDAAVSVRLSTASAIKQYFRSGAVLSFAQLKENDAEALEFLAGEKSRIVRKPLSKLGIPEGVVVGSVIRNGEVIVPRGDTQVQEGDRVVVFALPSAVDAVEKLFE